VQIRVFVVKVAAVDAFSARRPPPMMTSDPFGTSAAGVSASAPINSFSMAYLNE
jgi:hypothetical protein